MAEIVFSWIFSVDLSGWDTSRVAILMEGAVLLDYYTILITDEGNKNYVEELCKISNIPIPCATKDSYTIRQDASTARNVYCCILRHWMGYIQHTGTGPDIDVLVTTMLVSEHLLTLSSIRNITAATSMEMRQYSTCTGNCKYAVRGRQQSACSFKMSDNCHLLRVDMESLIVILEGICTIADHAMNVKGCITLDALEVTCSGLVRLSTNMMFPSNSSISAFTYCITVCTRLVTTWSIHGHLSVHGYKLALECKSAIRACKSIPEIVSALADLRGRSNGYRRLVAYYTTRNQSIYQGDVITSDCKVPASRKVKRHSIP